MRPVALLVTLLLSTGCSLTPRGFDHGALVRAARVDREMATDADIAGAIALRPELSLPVRLAVWFRPAGWWREFRFFWSAEDREVVLGALRPLADAGIVGEIVVLADSVVTGDDLRAARLAAARHRAEVVLVVTGASAVDRYSNPAALLYCTVAGLWVVPGTRADGVFFATGSLWDVRNGFLHAATEAKGTFGAKGPAMLLSDEEVVEGAKRAALTALADELRVRVGSLREPAPVEAKVR